jgi:hypothetical protein
VPHATPNVKSEAPLTGSAVPMRERQSEKPSSFYYEAGHRLHLMPGSVIVVAVASSPPGDKPLQ